jgi:transcriptional regulator with XRE-family HTH domain
MGALMSGRLRPVPAPPPPGFGALLERYRCTAGWSCADLARRIPCTPGYISRLERDERVPARGLVARVIRAFGLPAAEADRFYLTAGFAPEWLMQLAAVARVTPAERAHAS